MFKLCPNCGAHNAPTANFCTKCGANLAGVAATQPQAPATPDTTNGEADTVSATSQSPVATAPTANAKSGAVPETAKPISTQTTQADTAADSQAAPTTDNTATHAPTSQAPQPTPQPNPTVEATKQYAGSYWRYLVDSIKHPASIERTYHSYFGLTSLAITIVSLALTIALRAGSAFSSLPGSLASSVMSTFLKLLVLVAILAIGVIAIYYLGVRGILGDRRRRFLDFTTDYAFHCNWMVFFSVFTLLMQILGLINVGSAMLISLLLTISLSLFFLAGPYMLFTAQSTNHFDKIYALLIVSVLLAIVFMVITMFGLASIMGSLYQGLNDFGRSFNY
ncbi:DUF6574 domain-containing protein [Lacticaseibacillus rhamnosus]|uniref:DUF6574 domain-containing protein n=1 Tax=Lacticaseibacillus rhamnosus TaxID=47715 RepID=UPI002FBD4775